jgi:hypothetical protein
VPTLDILPYCDPLDLLRRFAPTPLGANVSLEFARIRLETNDLNLLSALPISGSPASDCTLEQPMPSCLWKIVRDPDVHQKLAEPSTITAGNLMVHTMGPACIMGADRDRKEILAFLGVEVDARVFRESIVPALIRLTEFVTHPTRPAPVKTEGAVPVGDQCHA